MSKAKIAAVALSVICAMTTVKAEMTYYLVAQWIEGGNRFCKYGDGTVLNVGYKLCPLSIKN